MSTIWVLLAANLAMTAVMAVAVAVAGWLPPWRDTVRQHPRLRHALWLLVVVKLLTPPVFELPVLPVSSWMFDVRALDRESTARYEFPSRDAAQHQPNSSSAVVFPKGQSVVRKPESPDELTHAARQPMISANPVQSSAIFESIFLGGILGLPTALVLARSLWQMRRVAWLLDQAPQADERVGRISMRACRRMGIGAPVEIRLVAGRLMPLLWVRSGRPVVVLPAPLLERLDDEQIECIVCHELAHFLRHDHWSNAFVLGVAALYWWFPVVWWARRELLAAQEQCCDALVIDTTGIPRRRYAVTLFETIEFINDERLLLPVLASGFSKVSALRRRFEMIARHNVASRIPGLAAGLVLLIAAGFFCLPVSGEGKQVVLVEAEPAVTATDPAVAQQPITHKANPAAVPVIEKVVLKYRTAHVAVDSRKHCLYIGQAPALGQGALRVDLDRGETYTVSAAGKAFMSDDTGVDADPFPGVVLYYSTDDEDGYAVRYVVLKPGESVSFKTPYLISPQDEVFVAAFFLDAWPDSDNHGSYTLTFQRADEVASRRSPTSAESARRVWGHVSETQGTPGGAEATSGIPFLSEIPLINRMFVKPRSNPE